MLQLLPDNFAWDRFTCFTEECGKRCALRTANNLIGPAPVGSDPERRDFSSDGDESWDAHLKKQGFPGYLEPGGRELFGSLGEGEASTLG